MQKAKYFALAFALALAAALSACGGGGGDNSLKVNATPFAEFFGSWRNNKPSTYCLKESARWAGGKYYTFVGSGVTTLNANGFEMKQNYYTDQDCWTKAGVSVISGTVQWSQETGEYGDNVAKIVMNQTGFSVSQDGDGVGIQKWDSDPEVLVNVTRQIAVRDGKLYYADVMGAYYLPTTTSSIAANVSADSTEFAGVWESATFGNSCTKETAGWSGGIYYRGVEYLTFSATDFISKTIYYTDSNCTKKAGAILRAGNGTAHWSQGMLSGRTNVAKLQVTINSVSLSLDVDGSGFNSGTFSYSLADTSRYLVDVESGKLCLGREGTTFDIAGYPMQIDDSVCFTRFAFEEFLGNWKSDAGTCYLERAAWAQRFKYYTTGAVVGTFSANSYEEKQDFFVDSSCNNKLGTTTKARLVQWSPGAVNGRTNVAKVLFGPSAFSARGVPGGPYFSYEIKDPEPGFKALLDVDQGKLCAGSDTSSADSDGYPKVIGGSNCLTR